MKRCQQDQIYNGEIWPHANSNYEIPLFGTHPNFGIRDVLDGVPKKGSENASKAASKV